MKFLLEGFWLGLATGAYCLGGCLPLLLPHYLSEKRSWREGIWIVLEFLLGRLAAYLAVGAVFGLAGYLGRGIVGGRIASMLLALAGALLLAGGIARTFPDSAFCRRMRNWRVMRRLPLAAGLLLGANLCPPFLAGVTAAVSYGSVAGGILLFSGFFAASSVYLLPLSLLARISAYAWLQDVARAFAVLAGFYFLVQGFSGALF